MPLLTMWIITTLLTEWRRRPVGKGSKAHHFAHRDCARNRPAALMAAIRALVSLMI